MSSTDRDDRAKKEDIRELSYSPDTPSMLVRCMFRDWPAAAANVSRHQHNVLQVCFCPWGDGSMEIGGQIRHFGTGSIMIIPGGVPHMQSLRCSIPSRLHYLMIDQERLLGADATRASGSVVPFLRGCFLREWENGACFTLNTDRQDRYGELLIGLSSMNDADPAQAALIDATLCFLLTGLAQAASVPDEEMSHSQRQLRKLQKAVQLVKEEYHRPLTIAEMAKSCDISESYFRAVFADSFECTPQEYLNRYRVNRAMDMIRTTDKAMLDIALSCGFSSVSTFNRNFKRYTGFAPTEWRSQRG